jgi:hypothetical protein
LIVANSPLQYNVFKIDFIELTKGKLQKKKLQKKRLRKKRL